MPTVSRLTEQYISEHRSIKDCLSKGIINYSALARLISKDLVLGRKASDEAILVAAIRCGKKMRQKAAEDNIVELFRNSNVEVKNNIVIYTLGKNVYTDTLLEVEKAIAKEDGLFFSIEGTKTITVIVQRDYKSLVDQRMRYSILDRRDGLALVTLTSPGIDETPGAVNFITGLFYENDVNIEEFMSCHDDTLIVVDSKHLPKLMGILRFYGD